SISDRCVTGVRAVPRIRRAAEAPRDGYVTADAGSDREGTERITRGSTGDSARHRLWDVSLRHVVVTDGRWGVHWAWHRPDSNRSGGRSVQGISNARRRGTLPHRAVERCRRTLARPRPGVWNDDRTTSTMWLV